MASVTADRVRDRVNLSASDIPDVKVLEFIADAEVEVELETGLEIDYSNCTSGQAACITDLAALYCLAYITGGSASGTSFTIGDLSVKEVSGSSEGLSPAFLQQRGKSDDKPALYFGGC
ncbi:MAG: hypothetical protein ACOWW1_04010 [archaeon]|nr:hypothetical protein [Candidatus Bathyarchaeum sp.]